MLGKETSYQGRKEINVLILDLHNELWHNGSAGFSPLMDRADAVYIANHFRGCGWSAEVSVFDEYVFKGEKEILYQVNIYKK